MADDMNKPKDGWDKFGIVTKAFIPIVIVLVGLGYNRSQQEISEKKVQADVQRDQENRQADRLTTMIKNLSSDNPMERTVTINIASILVLHKQLPAEVIPTIVAASKSSDKDEARAAQNFVKAKNLSNAGETQSRARPSSQKTMPNDKSFLIYPQRDGNDVIVPQLLINAIPMFDDQRQVYAASEINGWLISGRQFTNPEALRLTTMKKEGNNWRAYNMAGKRFHPAQLINPNLPDPFTSKNIGWAKIENVYNLSEPFVDLSGSGPCLLVK